MLFQLGDYKFEGLKLPQSWGSNYGTSYAQVPIIGGKPVVQRLGEKLVEHELSVLFSDEFCKPQAEINALQLYRRNGNVLQLTGGDGVNYGRFVITEITIVNEKADPTGYISVISAGIKLLEYNSTTTEKIEAIITAKYTPMTPVQPSIFPAADVQAQLQTGTLKAQSISKQANGLIVKYNKIKALATEAKAVFDKANNKVQDLKKVYNRAKELQKTIDGAIVAVQTIKQAADIHNLNDLLSANTKMEEAMYNLTGASAPLAAFIGSREGGL